MKKLFLKNWFAAVGVCVCAVAFVGCEKVDTGASDGGGAGEELVSLTEVAQMLAAVPLGEDRMGEVYDAVNSSEDNGYDEEYMVSDLLSSPGQGVGETRLKSSNKAAKAYSRPLKELFVEFCRRKAGGGDGEVGKGVRPVYASGNGGGNLKRNGGGSADVSEDEYLRYLESSDMQIYWPDSQSWDGEQAPVITFAPDDESAVSNVGWFCNEEGEVEQVIVDEEMSLSRPVWVINRNTDSPFTSLEVIRKNNPGWEEGGYIEVTPGGVEKSVGTARTIMSGSASASVAGTGAFAASPDSTAGNRMLVLKSFTMLRHYDSWLRGGSEFFVKLGALDSFTARTEAELKLYNPEVTDFMIVVKRRELNVEKQIGTILVSDWTEQLEDCAFMIIEDDGGTQTTWSCSGTVKIKSKSYGFDVSIPLRSYDDIVWRGKLSRKYLSSSPSITGRFGDTSITFATEDW